MKREILHNGKENGFETFVDYDKDLIYFVEMQDEWVGTAYGEPYENGSDVYEKVATKMVKCLSADTEEEMTLSEEEIKETLKLIRL